MNATRTALVLLCATLFAAPAPARTWTNDKGETIEAVYIRESRGVAILNQDGEIIRAPLSRLSEEDREFIAATEALKRNRDWKTRNFDTFRGRYLRYEAGEVVFRTSEGEKSVPIGELASRDLRMLNLGTEGVVPSSGLGGPAGGIPADLPVVQRTWTDVNGKEIIAEYRGVEGDSVVLAMGGKEYRVPLSRLSAADRAYIDSRNPSRDPFEEEPPQVASTGQAAPPSFGPGSRPLGRPTTGATDAQQFSESMREQDRRRQERWAAERRRRQERLDQQRSEADRSVAEQVRKQQERMASRSTTPDLSPPSFPSSTPGSPTPGSSFPGPSSRFRSPSQPSSAEQAFLYQCQSCNKTWESSRDYGLGDRCPHCHVKFNQWTDENGNTSESPSNTRRRYKGVVKLAVYGVIGLASLIGWAVRKMS